MGASHRSGGGWHRAGALPALLLCALAPAVHAEESVAARAAPTLDDLRWPAATRTIAARERATIWAGPRRKAAIGALRRGARVTFTAVHPGDKRCPAWLSLAPRGFVCSADVAPSEEPVSIEEPARLGRYADIRGVGADAYDSADAIRGGVPAKVVPGSTFVAVRDKTVKVGGVRYHRTDQGYVAEADLAWKTPSAFGGLDVRATPPPGWPFAWVMPPKRAELVPVLAAPSRKAARVRELARRDVVVVHEQRGAYTRVGDGEWVESVRLRIARVTARPTGVGAADRWIDVDLDQQVLIAYEGDTPVHVTLVSTGRKKKYGTPTGIYRVQDKQARTRMRNPEGSKETWDVADVPWAMSFRKYFALHGAYWHDGFGNPRSHGCVNLAPSDARVLYDWTSPDAPAGWRHVSADADQGTPIRIRNKRLPDPPWRDFEGAVIDPPPASGASGQQ